MNNKNRTFITSAFKKLPLILNIAIVMLIITLSVGLLLNRADNSISENDNANDGSIYEAARTNISHQEQSAITESHDTLLDSEGASITQGITNLGDEQKYPDDFELAETIKTTLQSRPFSRNSIVTVNTDSESPPVAPSATILLVLEHIDKLSFDQMLWIYDIVKLNVPGISFENINIFDSNLNHYNYNFFGFAGEADLWREVEQKEVDRIIEVISERLYILENFQSFLIYDEEYDEEYDDDDGESDALTTQTSGYTNIVVSLESNRIYFTQEHIDEIKSVIKSSHMNVSFIVANDVSSNKIATINFDDIRPTMQYPVLIISVDNVSMR